MNTTLFLILFFRKCSIFQNIKMKEINDIVRIWCFELVNCDTILVSKGTVTTPGGIHNLKSQAFVCARLVEPAVNK